MQMQDFLKTIEKNPFRHNCVAAFAKEKAELRTSKEGIWGAVVRHLTPARLTTAWRMSEDPLMMIAGSGYAATEVRDRSFELQTEALNNLRGNRKLTKAKMSDALSSLKPTVDQTKVIAGVLYALKQIQTVCYDEETKTVWTVPEDLRAWSRGQKTLWVDSRCENMLDLPETMHLGRWISDREEEGWKIDWPVAEGTFDEIKAKVNARGIVPKAAEFGAKVKKDDWARCLGRIEAVEHLGL
jgi:hypothetical protein